MSFLTEFKIISFEYLKVRNSVKKSWNEGFEGQREELEQEVRSTFNSTQKKKNNITFLAPNLIMDEGIDVKLTWYQLRQWFFFVYFLF